MNILSSQPPVPDPHCPWCRGEGKMPRLVEHPEDATTHVEYVPCICVDREDGFRSLMGYLLAVLFFAVAIALLMAVAILG